MQSANSTSTATRSFVEPISEQKVSTEERGEEQKESVLQMGTLRSFSPISQTEDGTELMEDDGETDQPEESLNIALYETLLEHEEEIVNALTEDAFRSPSTLQDELMKAIKKQQLFSVEDLDMIAASFLADTIVFHSAIRLCVGDTQSGDCHRRKWEKSYSPPQTQRLLPFTSLHT